MAANAEVILYHQQNPKLTRRKPYRPIHVIQTIPDSSNPPQKMKKGGIERARIKQRPIELAVDYLISANPEIVEQELAFLSSNDDSEFETTKYIAVSSTAPGIRGWRVFQLGRWQGQPALEGRKLVISGVEDEFREKHTGHVLVQRVTPSPLDTIVFKVSELDYDTVAEEYEAFEKLRSDGVVLRAGKTLELNGFRVDITSCEPVRQGLLGEETEIILVTDSEEKSAMANGIGTPFSFTSQNDFE